MLNVYLPKIEIMIQRVQSLFLLGVVLLGVCATFLPIVEIAGYEKTMVVNAFNASVDGVMVAKSPIGYLALVTVVTALGSIFLYKNRSTQIKLCKLNLLLISLFLAASVFISEILIDKNDAVFSDAMANYQIGVGAPFLALILNYLAIRFIKKDEALVKAADRLR